MKCYIFLKKPILSVKQLMLQMSASLSLHGGYLTHINYTYTSMFFLLALQYHHSPKRPAISYR